MSVSGLKMYSFELGEAVKIKGQSYCDLFVGMRVWHGNDANRGVERCMVGGAAENTSGSVENRGIIVYMKCLLIEGALHFLQSFYFAMAHNFIFPKIMFMVKCQVFHVSQRLC